MILSMVFALAACDRPQVHTPTAASPRPGRPATALSLSPTAPRSTAAATPSSTQRAFSAATATVRMTDTPTLAARAASATAPPTRTATSSGFRVPAPAAALAHPVLANYFAWFSEHNWDDSNISAGDRPEPPYDSDDPATIGRQIGQALAAGIDGFTLQWFAPGERTDTNLRALLAQSRGTGFRSTVVIIRHLWPGSPRASQAEMVRSISYVLEEYAGHPNFLTLEGHPMLLFANMGDVPATAGQTAQQAWAAIRARTDPERRARWIAEGLDASYLETFDGLYVYKVTHADYPDDYRRASRWASNVRSWEAKTGLRKLWWATLMPGYDDLRSGCMADLRGQVRLFKRDRQDGAFYRATFDAAVASRPDGLWINSFNEWVEGTYIEPGDLYGDRYLRLTEELVAQFRRE